MNPSPAIPKKQRVINALLIGMFFVLLWLPTLDTVFHFDHELLFYEKRLPAQFPLRQRGPDGLKRYLAGLNAYFDDHFGFRRRLIHWHNQMDARLLGVSSVSDVIMGNDGWLFYAGSQMVDNYRGVSQFTAGELQARQALLEQRRDWLAQRGIQYVFIIAPDKQSIYPEHLAAWLKPVHYHTKFDQFLDYMRLHSTVKVLDLRPALIAAKPMAPTYYHTDEHWNFFGAWVASREILKSLFSTDGEPLSLNSFQLEKQRFNQGNLADLMGIAVTEDNLKPVPKTNVPSLSHTNPFPQFKIGNEDYTVNSNAEKTCIIFGDSFRIGLEPYLGYHFKTVVYFSAPGGFDTNIVKITKPDVVISEIVERNFDIHSLTNN